MLHSERIGPSRQISTLSRQALLQGEVRVIPSQAPWSVVLVILHVMHCAQVSLVQVAAVEGPAAHWALKVATALALASMSRHVVAVAHHLTARPAAELLRLPGHGGQRFHGGFLGFLAGPRAVC